MKRGEIIKELGDNIIPILQDICEDDNVIWEAIRELEGTRSIEEVRGRLERAFTQEGIFVYNTLKWFIKEED